MVALAIRQIVQVPAERLGTCENDHVPVCWDTDETMGCPLCEEMLEHAGTSGKLFKVIEDNRLLKLALAGAIDETVKVKSKVIVRA